MYEDIPPFSKSYVLKTTTRHMRRSIDISIRKSFDRLNDFPDDPDKKQEVYDTLAVLHTMREGLDTFQAENVHLFSDEE